MSDKQTNSGTQVNPEHIINSLTNRTAMLQADMLVELSEKDAVIIEQQNKINELQQKLGEKRVEEKANAKK